MAQQLTLSVLNGLIKGALSDAFPGNVWVVAEISELKENRSGHCYLELVEKEGNSITARSRATIWSYTYRMLKPYFETTTGQSLKQGIKILVQAIVEYHPAYGLSLNIKDIDPSFTLGDMAMQRKEILARLQNEGVFDMNKELQLPVVPQKIAVISSGTAAGYQDFITQLEHNEYGIKFYTKLFEAYMQGNETVPSIINALEQVFQYDGFFDAVAIIRGGGATADLSSFDDYELALNITQFPLPVITGIGHEKDDTVIDLVAHTRLKTPTAVAEFFVGKASTFYEQLLIFEDNILQFARQTIDFEKEKLERIAENLKYQVSGFINIGQNRLARRGNAIQKEVSKFVYNKQYGVNKLQHDFNAALSVLFVETKNKISRKQRILKRVVGEAVLNKKIEMGHLQGMLSGNLQRMLLKEHERIKMNENMVRLLNPENVLKRGFSLTLKNGVVVKTAQNLTVGDELETHFFDGEVKSKIIKQ